MKIIFQTSTLETIQKAFGKRDLAKLRKEVITDKNGHRRTVWVKNDKVQPMKPQKKTGQDVKNMHSYVHIRGDHVIFMKDGQPLTSKIIDLGRDGVTVLGTGKAKGQMFKLLHGDIKQVTKMINPDDAIRGLMDANSIKSVGAVLTVCSLNRAIPSKDCMTQSMLYAESSAILPMGYARSLLHRTLS